MNKRKSFHANLSNVKFMFFHSILDKEKKYEKKMESFTSNKKLSSSLCCTKTKELRERKKKEIENFFFCVEEIVLQFML